MSDNRFLAKLASDLDKPRGFAVLSRTGVAAFLADKPVSMLLGGGHWVQRSLAADGIAVIGQLATLGERELAARYGRIGVRIARLARSEDERGVDACAGGLDFSGNYPASRRSRCGRWRMPCGRCANESRHA